jgi:peptidylprolyl isomerase
MNLKPAMTAVAAAAVALGLAACGGSSKAGGIMLAPSGGDTTTTVAPATATATTPTATTTVTTPTSGPLATEPTITKPANASPTKLETKDLIVGTGATAEPGDTLYVNYVGALAKNGHVFDASWKDTPGKPFSFVLGQGQVIKGWDEGFKGMKEGGRRQLTIPASLAYGKSGSGSTIPPNAALVFVVDLLKVVK